MAGNANGRRSRGRLVVDDKKKEWQTLEDVKEQEDDDTVEEALQELRK